MKTADATTGFLRLGLMALFGVTLGVWTWKLLEPNPVPEPVRNLISLYDWLPFVLAKSLHAGGYAFLALLLGILLPSRWRWFGVAFLMLHGIGTEIGQTFIPNRSGTFRDVLIDWFGVAVGTGLIRWLPHMSPSSADQRPPVPS